MTKSGQLTSLFPYYFIFGASNFSLLVIHKIYAIVNYGHLTAVQNSGKLHCFDLYYSTFLCTLYAYAFEPLEVTILHLD
jgi:hypothetical protein